MNRRIVCVAVFVCTSPLTAFANAGVVGSAVKVITALPEASTLSLLGTGLVGIALAIRQRMKLELKPASSTADPVAENATRRGTISRLF